MKAYKGFDKELKCREFRFAIGETYTHEGKIKACNSGFHACTNPVDILNYYDPVQSRFAEVEMSGDMDTDTDDSKIACSTITIQRELSLTEFISICADYIVNNVDKEINNSGNSSLASNSGNSSLASNSGNRSLASNS
ncbi:hypothetical protein JZU46_06540, partial [bacterium]|nr:hypothetical protein [bacterium]